MNRFYAICPFCKKSVFIEENPEEGYVCPACGHVLDLRYLSEHNCIMDITASDEEYTAAQQYFVNGDFKAAGEHLRKVLQYNRNHYIAYYYMALCDIYENEGKADFDIPHQIIGALISSIDKMGLSQVGITARVEFLTAALNQTFIILSSHFNKVYDNYEKTEMWDIVRDKCINLATAVKDLANVDKESLMVFDAGIVKSLIGIADIGICACRKIVEPHLISEKILDLPTEYQYERAKSCYGLLMYYTTSLDSAYNDEYKPDFTANLLFNQNVLAKLDRYNSENRIPRKKLLSTPGEALEDFRKFAKIAIKYSYHTCFKNLSSDISDQARIALINDSIAFCLELLIPRIYYDKEKKLTVNALSYNDAKELAAYLEVFLDAFDDYNHKLAADYVNRFYMRLYEKLRMHYTLVGNSYGKNLNKLKESQNSDYRYYKNILHNVIYACSLALDDIIPYLDHYLADRIKVLKLGKQVLEEFLLLNDYNVDELSQSVKYSDVLDIYNEIDDCLEKITAINK